MRNSRWIWPINGPDHVGISQSEKTGSGSDVGHRRSAIADDRIDGSQRRIYKYTRDTSDQRLRSMAWHIGASGKPRGRGLYILRYAIAIISRQHIAIGAFKGAGPFAHIYLQCDTRTRRVYSTLSHIILVSPAAFFPVFAMFFKCKSKCIASVDIASAGRKLAFRYRDSQRDRAFTYDMHMT